MPGSELVSTVDLYGRTPLADGMKRQVTEAFAIVPEHKRGALIVIADEQGARAHLAGQGHHSCSSR